MPPTTLSCLGCALRPPKVKQFTWCICAPDSGFCSKTCMSRHVRICIQCFCSVWPRPRPQYALAAIFPVLGTWSLHWQLAIRIVPPSCTPSCNECIVCETCHRCGPVDHADARFTLEYPSVSGIPQPAIRPTIMESGKVDVEDESPLIKIYSLKNTETHIYPVNEAVRLFTGGRQEEVWTGPLVIIACSKINCIKKCWIRDITMDDVNAAREFLAATRKRVPSTQREIIQRRDRVLSNILDNMLRRGTT